MRVIGSVESAQALESFVAAYAPGSGRLLGINGQLLPPAGDEAVDALQRALASARENKQLDVIARVAALLGLAEFERFNLLEARQRMEEACSTYRTIGHTERVAAMLGNLAVVDFYLGNSIAALSEAHEAVRLAVECHLLPLSAYLLCSLGAVLCYAGQYVTGSETFGEARSRFVQADDALGLAWWQYVYGREYARAQGHFAMTIEQLESALLALGGNVAPHIIIETLLALADCYVHHGNLRRAADIVRQADSLVAAGKHHWYRPEAYLVKAKLAVAEGNFKQASSHAHAGLGAVGLSGDIRMLAALYRFLAFLLERDQNRIDDAYDALSRAIAIGRKRASRLDLALALQQTGLHLRRYASRSTHRARGSGFLFEAHHLFREMDLATASGSSQGAALAAR